jgi:hypothetical protein
MDFKGFEYRVLQTTDPQIWRWVVQLKHREKSGVSPSREIAVKKAMVAINDALAKERTLTTSA